MLAMIGKHPQLTGFSYTDPEGNFLYVTRNAQRGLDTNLIDRRNGGRKVTRIRRDADAEVVDTAEDPNDTFDVLTRSWYVGAVNEGRPFWTPPYLFFAARRPGITYTLPHYAAKRGLVSVLGIDIDAGHAQHLPEEPEDRGARQGDGYRRAEQGDRLPVRRLDRKRQGGARA